MYNMLFSKVSFGYITENGKHACLKFEVLQSVIIYLQI